MKISEERFNELKHKLFFNRSKLEDNDVFDIFELMQKGQDYLNSPVMDCPVKFVPTLPKICDNDKTPLDTQWRCEISGRDAK